MDLSSLAVWVQLFGLLKISLGLDRDLSCAVCRAMIDEVSYSISKADPKKMIQVGSFRIDSKGNQGTYQRPYARSEVHLIEVFENICETFKDYAQATNDDGRKSVGRVNARDGKALSLKGISISASVQKQFKHKCESLVEEYDEEMISIFRRGDDPDIEQVICAELSGECSMEDLAVPMPQTEMDLGGDAPGQTDNRAPDSTEDSDNASEPEAATADDIVDEAGETEEDSSTTGRQEL